MLTNVVQQYLLVVIFRQVRSSDNVKVLPSSETSPNAYLGDTRVAAPYFHYVNPWHAAVWPGIESGQQFREGDKG